MLVQILFYAFAVVLVASALGMIISRNPVHAALALVMCFVTSAAIWLLIGAEFLAVVLVLVYVGRGDGAVPVRGHDAGYQSRGAA